MKNHTCEKQNKSLSKTKSKSNLTGCCNRRQFLATTAFLGGGAHLLATGNSLAQDGKYRIEGGQAAPVHIPHASILMRSPNSALFGITTDEVIEITYAEVLKFHGYCGGGAAFAFRMAQEAFKALYGDQLPVRRTSKSKHHTTAARLQRLPISQGREAILALSGLKVIWCSFRRKKKRPFLQTSQAEELLLLKCTSIHTTPLNRYSKEQ